MLLLATELEAQGTHIQTEVLDLWLKLLLPIGVCTQAEIYEADRLEGHRGIIITRSFSLTEALAFSVQEGLECLYSSTCQWFEASLGSLVAQEAV